MQHSVEIAKMNNRPCGRTSLKTLLNTVVLGVLRPLAPKGRFRSKKYDFHQIPPIFTNIGGFHQKVQFQWKSALLVKKCILCENVLFSLKSKISDKTGLQYSVYIDVYHGGGGAPPRGGGGGVDGVFVGL